jgi:hypothetical protein
LTYWFEFGIVSAFQPQVAFLAESARNKNEVVKTFDIWPLPGLEAGSQAATDGVCST